MANVVIRRNTWEHASDSSETRDPDEYAVYKSQRKANKGLLQKKKHDVQNAPVEILLDSMNNSKEFLGQIRKYRRRTCIYNDISAEEWI